MDEETKQKITPDEEALEQEEELLPEDEALPEDGEEADEEEETDEEEADEEGLAEDGEPSDEDGIALTEDEEGDEEEPSLAVTVTTTIDGPLLDTMARIMARQTKESTRRSVLIGAIAAVVVAIFCLSHGRILPGFVLWVGAVMLFQTYFTTSEKSARKRLAKSEGQAWDYTVAEDGIHVGKTVDSPCITWRAIKKAWLEDGYYIFEVKNSSVVIRQSGLSDSDRNTIELLMLEHVSDCKL